MVNNVCKVAETATISKRALFFMFEGKYYYIMLWVMNSN